MEIDKADPRDVFNFFKNQGCRILKLKDKKPLGKSWEEAYTSRYVKEFGILLEDNKFVCIDIDAYKAETDKEKNELELFLRKLKSFNTYYETTPRGGYHFIFKFCPFFDGMTKKIELKKWLDILVGKCYFSTGVKYSTYLNEIKELDDEIRKYLEDCIDEVNGFDVEKKELTLDYNDDIRKDLNEKQRKILDLINIDYWSKYNTWIKLGLCLFNEGFKFEVFDEYSKKASNYGKTWDTWKNFKKSTGGLSWGTICYFSRISNPVEYLKISDEIKTTNLYIKILTDTYNDYNLCKCFENIDLNLVCVEPKENFSKSVFYCFRQPGIWSIIDHGTIKKTYLEEFLKNLKHYFFIIEDLIDKEKDIRKHKRIYDNWFKLIKQVSTNSNVNNALNLWYPSVIDKDFLKKLDSKSYLFGFKNGVYDFQKDEFRPYLKEDYISKFVDFDFQDKITYKDKIEDIINKSGSNDPINIEFIKRWLGYCLTGEINKQVFTISIGSGSNGKSVLVDMMLSLMGPYGYTMNSKSLLDKSTTYHKDLVNINGKRFIKINELKNEKLNIDLIKSLVGDEFLNVERLYQSNSGDLKNSCKLWILSNNEPVFNGDDGGIRRRGVCINHNLKFGSVKDVEEGKADYVKDLNLYKIFNNIDFKISLFNYLKTYAVEFYKDGCDFKINEKFTKRFEELADSNDEFKTFMDEFFTITNLQEDFYGLDVFVNLMKDEGYNYSKKEIKIKLKKLGIEFNRSRRFDGVKGIFVGLKLKEDKKAEDF